MKSLPKLVNQRMVKNFNVREKNQYQNIPYKNQFIPLKHLYKSIQPILNQFSCVTLMFMTSEIVESILCSQTLRIGPNCFRTINYLHRLMKELFFLFIF